MKMRSSARDNVDADLLNCYRKYIRGFSRKNVTHLYFVIFFENHYYFEDKAFCWVRFIITMKIKVIYYVSTYLVFLITVTHIGLVVE